MDLAEDQSVSSLETEQVEKSNRSQQGRLEEKPGDRPGPRLFAQQTIDSEGQTEDDSDPGEFPVPEREVEYANESEQDGNQLPAGQAFAQENRAEKNVDERGHEVSQARFNHAVDIYRPNENQPVDRNRQSACDAIEQRPSRAGGLTNLRPTPLPGQQDDQEKGSPNEAVGDNLNRGNRLEQFPVNRDESPGGESGEAGDQRGTFFTLQCRRLSARMHRIALLFHGFG